MTEAAEPAASGHVTKNLGGREIILDAEGFLVDPHAWTEAVGEAMAAEDGTAPLAADHWRVIRFLRDYWLERGKSPLSRDIRTATGLSLLAIEKMFAGGIKHGARRLAGLPNPRGCM